MTFPQVSGASSWQHAPMFPSLSPRIPPHCEPSSDFLFKFSSIFHACIPTPLAFVSTVLGFFSILCWLFAQLPQIFKNYRLRSTSGLSIYFLVEWCLGDMSNFFGAILTEQAAWQIIVAAYYCSVDVILVAQWVWFEGLGKGRQIKPLWKRPDGGYDTGKRGGGGCHSGMQQIIEGAEPQASHTPRPIPSSAFKDDLFSTPNYGSIQSSDTETPSTPRPANKRTMPRLSASPFPSLSPRTTLMVTLLIALASVNASPTTTPPIHSSTHTHTHAPPLGTILSWLSTILYLLSRLPQLLKNLSRRSTAGLSPLLFLAAFFGNLFYSTSLLCNPSLWADLAPYGGGGWAGPHGSRSSEWAARALPFFLGAAGVLVMDAAVGVQFWLWGEKEVAIVGGSEDGEGADGAGGGRTRRWSVRTSGWMRGWVPSATLGRLRWSASSSSTYLPGQGRGEEDGEEEEERLIAPSAAR